ncbi:hypothetical protein ACTXT7_005552 [Hymenolepis weldensis]
MVPKYPKQDVVMKMAQSDGRYGKWIDRPPHQYLNESSLPCPTDIPSMRIDDLRLFAICHLRMWNITSSSLNLAFDFA